MEERAERRKQRENWLHQRGEVQARKEREQGGLGRGRVGQGRVG